jgi:cation diffusion facilitator family transporter
VLADALTSVLAIVALTLGKLRGWIWLDPVMGIVGGAVVARWSWGLLRETGHILLDSTEEGQMVQAVRAAIENGSGDRVSDLHVWRVGPGDYAAILAVVSDAPAPPEHYKRLLAPIEALSHITVEVHARSTAPPGPV